MGLWYATAPAVLRTADEAAAPQLPGDLQQPNNCLPAAAELGWATSPSTEHWASRAGCGAPPLRPRISPPSSPGWGGPRAGPRRHLHCTVQWS